MINCGINSHLDNRCGEALRFSVPAQATIDVCVGSLHRLHWVQLHQLPVGCLCHHLHNRNTHFPVSCFSLDGVVLSDASSFWLLQGQLFLLLKVDECLLHPFV